MVTLTLIQGVLNTFVIFLARIVGTIVERTVFRIERGTGPGYYITGFVCEIVFAILAPIIVALVLALARVPRRSRLGRIPRLLAADDACPRASGAASSREHCPNRCARWASPTARGGWRCSRATHRSSSGSRRFRRSAGEPHASHFMSGDL
jgi:hypothetical protein